jgi:DNA-binding GntR family transcriptional regulator
MTNSADRPRRGPTPAFPATAERTAPYDMLKSAILRGELKPGTPLVETTLAAWCQVSRTPVREALTRLEQDGLVERSDRGLIVRRRSPEEILDIYETRIALEATAGRIAAERRTDHDLRVLRKIIDHSHNVTGDDERKVDLNRQFHRAVWHASHNEPLLDLLERLNLHLLRYPATTLSYPNRWEEAKREHIALVGAIEARDGGQAYDIAHAHFTKARDIRLRLWDDSEIDAQ